MLISCGQVFLQRLCVLGRSNHSHDRSSDHHLSAKPRPEGSWILSEASKTGWHCDVLRTRHRIADWVLSVPYVMGVRNPQMAILYFLDRTAGGTCLQRLHTKPPVFAAHQSESQLFDRRSNVCCIAYPIPDADQAMGCLVYGSDMHYVFVAPCILLDH